MVVAAIGTWMRVGEGTRLPEDDSVGQAWRKEFLSEPDAWRKAEQAFAQALLVVPNSVRVLQNIATMKLLQFDRDVDNPERARFLKEGKEALLGVWQRFGTNGPFGYLERSDTLQQPSN